MPQNYVPIFIFIALIGILIPVTLLAAKLVRPENPSKEKLMPYECGIDPVDYSRGRYTVRYYIVAILFVVFDVETIFLFPWAVKFKALGMFGLTFVSILPEGAIRFPATDTASGMRNAFAIWWNVFNSRDASRSFSPIRRR